MKVKACTLALVHIDHSLKDNRVVAVVHPLHDSCPRLLSLLIPVTGFFEKVLGVAHLYILKAY